MEKGACSHVMSPPTADALSIVRNACRWRCQTCSFTDGVWVCLTCGHTGCSRDAVHPCLGGVYIPLAKCLSARLASCVTPVRRCVGGHALHHHVCSSHPVAFDVISKTAHCYACDAAVIEPPVWLTALRAELVMAETDRPTPDLDNVPDTPTDTLVVLPGWTGLANLGNTCYMNAVVQLLASLQGFRSFFCDYLKAGAPLQLGNVAMQRCSTKDWHGAAQCSTPPETLEMTMAVHGLLRVLWSGRYRTCAPHALVQAVWTHAKDQFANRRQNE